MVVLKDSLTGRRHFRISISCSIQTEAVQDHLTQGSALM